MPRFLNAPPSPTCSQLKIIHPHQSTTGQFTLAPILGVGHKNVQILGVGLKNVQILGVWGNPRDSRGVPKTACRHPGGHHTVWLLIPSAAEKQSPWRGCGK